MTAAWNTPLAEIAAIVDPYRAKVDSIMSPVIGKSAMEMKAARPEGLLSNLIADVLRQAATPHLGKPADFALTNIGGIRTTLPKGDITFGNIFEILPFDNSLCILSMRGKDVKELMQNIVGVRGEGLSNVLLKANSNKEILELKIDGEPLDEERLYQVATIDYLSEGNDKMVALLKAEKKMCFPKEKIRDIFVDYIKRQTAQGKEITSRLDGRITIE